MTGVLLGLGDYRFSVDTAAFDQLQRRTEWRWGNVDRIGRLPALQYLGPGGDEITLRGVVYPHVRGGAAQIDTMVESAGKGVPLTLVAGSGTALGRWCIVNIERTHSALFADGMPRKQEFGLTLKLYGDDASAVGAAGKVAVPATASAASAPVSFGTALSAVTPLAPQLSAAGATLQEGAATMVGMSKTLASHAAGLVGDLAGVVAKPLLTAMGLPETTLARALASNPVRAVVSVVDGINALPAILRQEAADVVFGPDLSAPSLVLTRAADAASMLGRPWTVV